jgi:hypothetical protein
VIILSGLKLLIHSRLRTKEGRELMARERDKVGPVAQPDNDNQGLAKWVA